MRTRAPLLVTLCLAACSSTPPPPPAEAPARPAPAPTGPIQVTGTPDPATARIGEPPAPAAVEAEVKAIIHGSFHDPETARLEWLDKDGKHVAAPAPYRSYHYGYPNGRAKQVAAWEVNAHLNGKNVNGGFVGYQFCRFYYRDGKLCLTEIPAADFK